MSDDKTLLIQRIRDGSINKRNELIGVDLSGADLSGADLLGVNLSRANLYFADLRRADLLSVNLSEARLNFADLREAYLIGVNLIDASLRWANLSGANLYFAKLNEANFSEANFTGTQALDTDFTTAILTGSCIKDWNINSKTKLDGVICDYVYLKQNEQERRPHSGTFAPGDFAKLVQSSLETIDLIFREGLDWKALLISVEKLQVEVGDEAVSIRAIESKGDGDFIIRINVPEGLDKAQVEQYTRREYDLALTALTEKYQHELQLKEQEISSYRRENTNMMEIVSKLASRPINVEVKAVAESKSGDNITYNQSGAIIGSNVAKAESGSHIEVTQNITQEEKQSLAEAAAEIQRLLTQLEETNPTATESEQVSYVNVATKPDLKKKAIAAVKAFGETAIDEFFLENKWLKVGKSVVKGWLEAGS